jgi:DNA-binding NtrC family response regulator
VVRIQLPPLRARKEDIPLLIDYYLRALNARRKQAVTGFSREALALLLHHDWPGNIRELKNLIEFLCLDPPSGEISRAHLPESICPTVHAADPPLLNERERLLSALAATQGNKTKAAAQLGWSRMTLYRKIAKYHL